MIRAAVLMGILSVGLVAGCGGEPGSGDRDAGMDGAVALDASTECLGGCNDGIACTEDTCCGGECCHQPRGELCAEGERCSADRGCEPWHCFLDEECDDDLFCNGEEICNSEGPGDGCLPGEAIDCDDGALCTDDTCDEETRGCVNIPDQARCDDGLACTADACAPSATTGRSGCTTLPDDDACGYCTVGAICDLTRGCTGGTSRDCRDGDPCTTDTCSEEMGICVSSPLDADGDGAPASSAGGLACPGGTDCDDGDPMIYPGAAEICNGLDDDCDGAVDNGFECPAMGSGACTSSCGSTGTRSCSSSCSWEACTPPVETCNGVDDDCDGMVDEIYSCASGSSETCTSSCGSAGTRSCSATCRWGSCVPPAEVCNGLDDDCDSRIDNGFTCAIGSTSPCTTSCGSTGSRTCAADCTWGSCSPPSETCNGTDDDCDGSIDNGFTCARFSSGSCTTLCGSTGTRSCSPSCTWGSCRVPVEICNGVDDDCDWRIDNGFTCALGSTSSCTTSCSSTGSRTCEAGCAWGSCSPPAESCNARDDDCDGLIDEDFDCALFTAGSCTTSCGTTGTRPCSSSCTWRSCIPPPEACNGLDDDCDGLVDETASCIGRQVCTSGACRSIPPSCTGFRYGGHAYAICTDTGSRNWASNQCAFYGGHLVTLNSSGEQFAVTSRLTTRSWHGLYRDSSCTWRWVTGEPVTYTAWEPGQPDGTCPDQECGVFWYSPSYRWDNFWCSMGAAYVCEWDG